MIAQLMAQRWLVQNPTCLHAPVFRQAIRLCAAKNVHQGEIIAMQRIINSLPIDPDVHTGRQIEQALELADLCMQALNIRRQALRFAEPQVKFTLQARGRLIGA